MPKKQKRSVSIARPATSAAPAAPTAPTAPVTTTVSNRPVFTGAARRSSYSQEFNPDYSQVIQDLKRIGIMAGSFVAILVVLSFFLR